jgi:hypothetical protein
MGRVESVDLHLWSNWRILCWIHPDAIFSNPTTDLDGALVLRHGEFEVEFS